MPNVFQNNWAPKLMPITNLALTDNFVNAQINNMQSNYPPQNQGYPPQNQVYPNQTPMNNGYPPQQGYNQEQQMEMTNMQFS